MRPQGRKLALILEWQPRRPDLGADFNPEWYSGTSVTPDPRTTWSLTKPSSAYRAPSSANRAAQQRPTSVQRSASVHHQRHPPTCPPGAHRAPPAAPTAPDTWSPATQRVSPGARNERPRALRSVQRPSGGVICTTSSTHRVPTECPPSASSSAHSSAHQQRPAAPSAAPTAPDTWSLATRSAQRSAPPLTSRTHRAPTGALAATTSVSQCRTSAAPAVRPAPSHATRSAHQVIPSRAIGSATARMPSVSGKKTSEDAESKPDPAAAGLEEDRFFTASGG
nr:mucin-1-like [Drosophila suzukii]XP_036678147.1 mucin-1-like [Drosophila suzukii]